MQNNFQAMGIFLRFAATTSTSKAFFEQLVGLPLIRKTQNADIYWGGEASIFEVIYASGKDVVPELDPEAATALPIFRVHGLDALLARLAAAGVRVTEPRVAASGRCAYFADTDGYWVGLRERSEDAALPQDSEARRRWQRGETYNPGCRSMPQGFQELGWVVRRVANLERMAQFYRDVLGMVQIGSEGDHLLFDTGDNTIFELAPGGQPCTPPLKRDDASSACLFRVHDLTRIRSALHASGAHFVNERIDLHWTDLCYFADPEGALVGAKQARHPREYAPEKFIIPENLETWRRAREHAAAMLDCDVRANRPELCSVAARAD